MTRAYADLHLHLLPGVDDGPRTTEEALELARVLVDDGVEAATVTPHFNAWNPDLLASTVELEAHLAGLRALLTEAGLPLQVYIGAEHFLTPELIGQLRNKSVPTLAGGPYVLVELPFTDRPLFADEVLFELGLAGFVPVLAHPERYAWVQQDPRAVVPLVERGIVLQLTAASLLGRYGRQVRRTAEALLRHNAYQLASSDLHRAGQPRLLSQLEDAIQAAAGAETAAQLLHTNPWRVIKGEAIVAGEIISFDDGSGPGFLGRLLRR